MKTLIALILLLMVVTLICSPLIVIWIGVTAHLTPWEHLLTTIIGLLLCLLVKPVSIITGKDLYV